MNSMFRISTVFGRREGDTLRSSESNTFDVLLPETDILGLMDAMTLRESLVVMGAIAL